MLADIPYPAHLVQIKILSLLVNPGVLHSVSLAQSLPYSNLDATSSPKEFRLSEALLVSPAAKRRGVLQLHHFSFLHAQWVRERMGMTAFVIQVQHMLLTPGLVPHNMCTRTVITMSMTGAAAAVWVLSCAINMGVATWVWWHCGTGSGCHRGGS